MNTPTAYALDRTARAQRVQMLRLRRRAARTEGVVRALLLAAALATLVASLNGSLRDGAKQVVVALESASVR